MVCIRWSEFTDFTSNYLQSIKIGTPGISSVSISYHRKKDLLVLHSAINWEPNGSMTKQCVNEEIMQPLYVCVMVQSQAAAALLTIFFPFWLELCSQFKLLTEFWDRKNQLMLKVVLYAFLSLICLIKTIQLTPMQQRSQMWKLHINYLDMNSGSRLRKSHASIWLPSWWKARKAGQKFCNDSSFIDVTREVGGRKRWHLTTFYVHAVKKKGINNQPRRLGNARTLDGK
jgi:hypothetical protein